MNRATYELDVLIFGGGIAGLWLLDELHRRSFRAMLIEKNALGTGQTIASQGILHGGLKYALGGLLSGSASAVAEMTDHWRACLEGRAEPNLRDVRIASPSCFLWRTDALSSRVGLAAAKFGLRTPVRKIATGERPPALADCPGEILCVEEQVIDVPSLLRELAGRHADRILTSSVAHDVVFASSSPGSVDTVDVRVASDGAARLLKPAVIVFTAGEGNAELRRRVGLAEPIMQLRPLHMVMVRGPLPSLYGHCIDGNKTRVTITSVSDSQRRVVWQVGGEISEKGVTMSAAELISFAKRELLAVLPGVDFARVEWATYRIQRAEGSDPRGARPEGPVWRRERNVITAWPTKLVLAPRLAESIADSLGAVACSTPFETLSTSTEAAPIGNQASANRVPPVAMPPWEVTNEWHH